MIISRMKFNGNPSVGAFLSTSDTYVLTPPWLTPSAMKKVKKTLNTEIVPCQLGGSNLLGVFSVGNTKGMVVPYFAADDELEKIRGILGIPIERVPTSLTALGNVIIANDHGAMIHPSVEKPTVQIIERVLQVPIQIGTIAKSPLVGSAGVATNNGLLVHPMVTDKELEDLSDFFKVIGDVGTVMHGSPFVGVGLAGNIHGIVTSSNTTGPELARISQTFERD
jgi:translation initiation factor 6